MRAEGRGWLGVVRGEGTLVVARMAGVVVTAAQRCRAQNELVQCRSWLTLTPQPVLQNLEMHDRMEHLIEKQISHGHFSTQTWTKTENLGR